MDHFASVKKSIQPVLDESLRNIRSMLNNPSQSSVPPYDGSQHLPQTPKILKIGSLGPELQKFAFIQSLRKDDILIAKFDSEKISSVDDHDNIFIFCVAKDLSNDTQIVSDLKIKLCCPREYATSEMFYAGADPETDQNRGALMRVVVMSCEPEEIIVSGLNSSLPKRLQSEIKLGILEHDEIPRHCYISTVGAFTAQMFLQTHPLFNQPDLTYHYQQRLLLLPPNTYEKGSLSPNITSKYPIESYAKQLSKSQRSSSALTLVKNGYVELNAGSAVSALQCFNKAISTDPECHQAYHCRSLAYSFDGNFEKATEDLIKAISLKPEDHFEQVYKKELTSIYTFWSKV